MPLLLERDSRQARTQSDGTSDNFQGLVNKLSHILGPCSGLDSEEIDPYVIQQTMASYHSKESEWGRYAFQDPSRHYTRNLVDEGNGKSNLVSPWRTLVETLLTFPAAYLSLDSRKRQSDP